MEELLLKVPATTANLGLGFDSMGMAISKFLTIKAQEANCWQLTFLSAELEQLPKDQSNLIVKTAIEIAEHYGKEMPTLALEIASDIPLTHGLGSSSSAIVAGVELANYFCCLNLDQKDKLLLATQIEGHPDNVGPCITGGVFVGAFVEGQLYYESFDLGDLGIVLTVPPYELETKLARSVIPNQYSKSAAIEQNALNNVLVLAMLKNDLVTMGQLMMKDQFHEKYRAKLIAEFQPVRHLAKQMGAYATVISGAGPTILTLCPKDKEKMIAQAIQSQFPTCKVETVNMIKQYDLKE